MTDTNITTQIANYTIPELTSWQHGNIIDALNVAIIQLNSWIKEDPAFDDLKIDVEELEELDPRSLPDEVGDGYDTSDIREKLYEIHEYNKLINLFKKLVPHCANCGKVTTNIGAVHPSEPSICDECFEQED